MKRAARAIACCICIAGPAAAQDTFEALHWDAAMKWAEFLGTSDACHGRDRENEIEAEADAAAAVLRPSVTDWAFGARGDKAKSLASLMRLNYATARIAPECMGADLLERQWRSIMHQALDEIRE